MQNKARTQTSPFLLPLNGVITIRKASPKLTNSKSALRYALYRDGQTVQEYITASVRAGNPEGLAKLDLMWDWNHEFITVTAPHFHLTPLGAPVRTHKRSVLGPEQDAFIGNGEERGAYRSVAFSTEASRTPALSNCCSTIGTCSLA